MKRERISEFEDLLSLWKGKEQEFIYFSDINNAMTTRGWYTRKTVRRLEEMQRQRIIEKSKKGEKGARARYRPTLLAMEFDANKFFEQIRASTTKTGQFFKENESLLVYGIPTKDRLNETERDVLDHSLDKIEDAFENLFRLKQSIKNRGTTSSLTDSSLLKSLVLDRIAERFRDMVFTEAEIRAADQHRKGESDGIVKLLIETAKKHNIPLSRSDNWVELERKIIEAERLDDSASIYSPKSDQDADLAIMKTLHPQNIAKFELDPFGQLQKLIDSWQPANYDMKKGISVATNRPFDEADLYYIALAFERQMVFDFHESALTVKSIRALADWSMLTLKLGAENHERLIRCIYHFWKEGQKPRPKRTEVDLSLNLVFSRLLKHRLRELHQRSWQLLRPGFQQQ
jgi:hypothetical protein